MAASRPAVLAALGLAGVGGYYLYQAGGSPKVAEKKMEGAWCCPCRAYSSPC